MSGELAEAVDYHAEPEEHETNAGISILDRLGPGITLAHRVIRAQQEPAATNRGAVFCRQTEPGTLPCIQVTGIQVNAYLDHQAGAVRASVHLDTADNPLVRPDGTVPLRVEAPSSSMTPGGRNATVASRDEPAFRNPPAHMRGRPRGAVMPAGLARADRHTLNGVE